MCKIDDKKSRGTHRVTLFIDRNTTGYFDSFEIEYILQNVLSKVKDKSVIKNYLEYKIMILFWVDFIVSLSQNTSL